MANLEIENIRYEDDLRLLDANDKKIKETRNRLDSIKKNLASHEHNISLIQKSRESNKFVNEFLTAYSRSRKNDSPINLRIKIIEQSLEFKKYDTLIAAEIKETFIKRINTDHLQFQFDDIDYQFSLKEDADTKIIQKILTNIDSYKNLINKHIQDLEKINETNCKEADNRKEKMADNNKKIDAYKQKKLIFIDELSPRTKHFSKSSIKSF